MLPGFPAGVGFRFSAPEPAVAAIQAIVDANVDTDLDGTLDYYELIALTNPNGSAPAAEADCTNIPRYGCGARIAPAEPTPLPRSLSLGALGVFLAVFGLRRRGRR